MCNQTPNRSSFKTALRERMVDRFTNIVAAISPDGQFLDWNHRLREVTGYTDDEISCLPAMVLVPEEERPLLRAKVRQVLSGAEVTLESHLVTKDGVRIPYQLEGSLMTYEDRPIIYGEGRNIYERKYQEEELHERERKYRRLFEESQEGITVTAPDGTIIDVNPAACALNGYSREELIGMNASDLYANPEERGEIRLRLEEKGEFRNLEIQVRRKDGEVITCRVSASVMRGASGTVEAFQSYARDITEQKRAERALKESEKKFRTLAEKSPIGIALLQDGVYKYVNPALAVAFGYAPEDIVEHSPQILFHPDDWPAVRRRVEQRLAGNIEEAHYEARVRTKTGETRIAEIYGSRMIYEGTPAIIGTVQDVTEQKQAEEALRESERKFRELAEQSLLGIALIQDGTFKYVNSRSAELFGYETEELIGKKGPKDLAHPADWPRIDAHLRKRLAGEEEAVTYRMRGIRKDNQIIYLEIYGTRILSGGRPALLSYVMDLTDRRRLQKELLHIQEDERQRIGQDLHDGVASQLTGVNMILGSILQEVRNKCPSVADDLQQVKALIEESGEDVRRISRGLNPLHLQEADLPGALERLARTVRRSGGPSCSCQIRGTLGEIAPESTTHLYWIAQEAVTNARKYAGADTIVIRLSAEEDQVVLTIEDNGRGFDPSDMVEEEGLGLRTMRYRAELLGGTLSIDSAPGSGTTVHCRLPDKRPLT